MLKITSRTSETISYIFVSLANQFLIHITKQIHIYIKKMFRANEFPKALIRKKPANQIQPVVSTNPNLNSLTTTHPSVIVV